MQYKGDVGHNVFYFCFNNLKTSDNLTLKLYDPNRNFLGNIPMTLWQDGAYFVEHNFLQTGKYVGRIEDNEKFIMFVVILIESISKGIFLGGISGKPVLGG